MYLRTDWRKAVERQEPLEGRLRRCSLALAVTLIAGIAVAPPAGAAEPEITAQGFDMETTQDGVLGAFGRIRVRIEADERIEALSVKERSFEVDLAGTLDLSNLELFGLEKRPRQYKDVTLNLETYIDTKIKEEGHYQFLIRVTDEKAQSAAANLSVFVAVPKTAEAEAPAALLEKGRFTLKRVGAGDVEGGDDYGLSWKTVDPGQIVISIAQTQGLAGGLKRLKQATFESTRTKDQLQTLADQTEPAKAIELPTANNAAAGQVFAIVRKDKTYLFRIESSRTSLSESGTAVILEGEYKFR